MAATGFINGVSINGVRVKGQGGVRVKGQSKLKFTLTLDSDPIFPDPIFPLRMV